jgi:hypothetical protein
VAPYLYRFVNNLGVNTEDLKFRAFVVYDSSTTYQEEIIPELDHYDNPLILNEETVYSSSITSEHSGKSLLANTDQLGDFSMNIINSLDPILYFVSDSSFSYPVSISAAQGAYTFKVTAKVIDKLRMANTHVIGRLWFVPQDFIPTVDNIHQYRDQNEIIFKIVDGKTQAQIGKPSSLEDVFVSAALTDEYIFIDMVRYSSEVKKFETSGANSLKLCVGIYAISSLNSEYKNKKFSEKEYLFTPTVVFDLSSTTDGIQTPIQRSVTATLYPRRSSEFDNATYTLVDKPLNVSRELVNGSEVEEFILYSGVTISEAENAFINLLSLKKFADNESSPMVRLSFNSFSEKFDTDNVFVYDFCTVIRPLNGAKIDSGSWQIDLTPSSLASKIETLLNFKFSFEIMAVSLDGNVIERIYKTALFEDTYQIKFDIGFPFFLGNNNSQLILRINLYPYARNQNSSIGSIRESFGYNDLFYEFSNIEITNHTLKFLDLDAADSKLGSPGFYEDLDLVPGISFDDSQCWFILDDDLKNTMISTITDGIDVRGCLYSPTWALSMPEGTEVKSGALGYTNKDFWFRTVPGDTVIGEISISAVEDDQTFSTHVAYDDPSTAITFSDGKNYIKYFSTNSNEFNFYTKANLAGLNNQATVEIKGNNPQLFTMNNNGNFYDGNKSLGLMMGKPGEEGDSVDGFYNFSAGRERNWSRIGFDSEDNSFENSSQIVKKLSFASTANNQNNDLIHIAGILDNNKLVYCLANPTVIYANGISEDKFTWIAGTTTSENSNFISPVNPPTTDSPTITFPGIALDKYGSVYICYSSQSTPGSIFCKVVNNEIPTTQFPIIQFKNAGVAIPSSFSIKGINLVYNHYENNYVLGFWCNGRIFVASINLVHDISQGEENAFSITSFVNLVAGSREFDAANSIVDGTLQSLVVKGFISVKQSGEVESNVPSQKPGILISNNPGKQGEIHIWYKDSQDKLKSRVLSADGNVNNATGYA